MAKIDDSIKKKVPELRFKGFTDDWEQRKLTEIVNRVNKSSNSDVLPKVEFEDIVSGEGRLNKDISSKFDSRKGTLFEPENILYGKLRPYLKNWLFSDFEGVALGDFWVFEATDVSVPSFDYYLIQSDNYQKVANDTSGTKMPRSDWKNVSSTDFAIPSKDEQKQIGAFFKQLDNTIVLHQRRLDLLKEQKKGYLQKMFPKNGAKVPELRFAGFADDWEERKLSNYITITGGNAWKSSDYSIGGDYLVVTIANVQGQRNINDKIGNKISVADPGKYLLKREDILVSLTGNVGRVSRMTDIPAVLNQRVGLVKPKTKKIDDEFLFQVLSNRRFESSMVASGQGAAQANISNNDVLSYELLVPQDVREQSIIAHFFRNFDNAIALHQHKLELLKEKKKGFLQKMFV